MKQVVLVLIAMGLASCDTYQDLQEAPSASSTRPGVGKMGSIKPTSVLTDKSVPQYYADSQQCERQVAATMGAPGAGDSLDALKRALKDQAGQKTVTVSYINQDQAMARRNAVNSCLSHKGYLVRP